MLYLCKARYYAPVREFGQTKGTLDLIVKLADGTEYAKRFTCNDISPDTLRGVVARLYSALLVN